MRICLGRGNKVKRRWARFTMGVQDWQKRLASLWWLLREFLADMLEEDRELITSGTRGVLSMRRLLSFLSIVPVAWTLIWRMKDYRILTTEKGTLLLERLDTKIT